MTSTAVTQSWPDQNVAHVHIGSLLASRQFSGPGAGNGQVPTQLWHASPSELDYERSINVRSSGRYKATPIVTNISRAHSGPNPVNMRVETATTTKNPTKEKQKTKYLAFLRQYSARARIYASQITAIVV